SGTGGDVLVIGQSSVNLHGQILTTGHVPGSLNVAGAEPRISTGAQVINGVLTNGSAEAEANPLGHAAVPVTIQAPINTSGGAAGNINVLTHGSLTVYPGVTILAGGQIFLGTKAGVIDLQG